MDSEITIHNMIQSTCTSVQLTSLDTLDTINCIYCISTYLFLFWIIQHSPLKKVFQSPLFEALKYFRFEEALRGQLPRNNVT